MTTWAGSTRATTQATCLAPHIRLVALAGDHGLEVIFGLGGRLVAVRHDERLEDVVDVGGHATGIAGGE